MTELANAKLVEQFVSAGGSDIKVMLLAGIAILHVGSVVNHTDLYKEGSQVAGPLPCLALSDAAIRQHKLLAAVYIRRSLAGRRV